MRAYTSAYLACCLLSGLGFGCSAAEPEPYSGPPTLHDEQQPDAGPTNCALQGTWEVTLSTQDECSPELSGAAITLVVDDHADSDDFTFAELPPSSPCGEYKHDVEVAADGCTITTASRATWCSAERPQCTDYQLTLQVHDDEAEVKGTYRRCWCGSPSAFGTKVEVAGSAVRR